MTDSKAQSKRRVEAYDFLLATGEVRMNATIKQMPHAMRCVRALRRLSQMNGHYEDLPEQFREGMRKAVDRKCDIETKLVFGEITELAQRLDDQDSRDALQKNLHALSRYWPVNGRIR